MFNAFGTEGLELFTWIVAFLVAFGAALSAGHLIKVMREDQAESEEEDHNNVQEEDTNQQVPQV